MNQDTNKFSTPRINAVIPFHKPVKKDDTPCHKPVKKFPTDVHMELHHAENPEISAWNHDTNPDQIC